MPGITVGERILVHLSGFVRFGDAYECPPEMTQDGIASALGLSRAHVALELKRLRTAGRVEERMAHVAAARTRRKVYGLTPAGGEIARRMREHARTRAVVLVTPEGTREVPGERALEALKARGLRESQAVQRLLASDVIEALPPAPPPEPPAPRRPFVGREAELAALRTWMATGREPVAVVVGVAGIGKSALLAKALENEARPTYLRRLYPHDDAHGVLASCGDFLARLGRRRLKALVSRPATDPLEALAVLREDVAGCLLAFDDLHACPAAEGVLRGLLERPPAGKILVAGRAQPTFYDRSSVVRGQVLELALGGLDDAAAGALLAARRPDLAPAEAARVLRAARGHPLSLELFAASGLDAGQIEADRFIVETVLDGLDDVPEAVLKGFAVLRRPAKSPEALGASVAQLRRLVRRAVLEHRGEGYLLHDLVKEFYARRMSPPEARSAHRRAASYWEGREDALEAAHHRIEAGDEDGAARLLAVRGEAYAEGARAGDLEACLLRLPESKRPLPLLARTQAFLGRFEDARHSWEAVVGHGSWEERLSARIQLGRLSNRLGDPEAARRELSAAVRDAAAAGRPNLEGAALRALGGAERRLGDLDLAVSHLQEAADLLEGDAGERARARLDLGAALIARGDLAGARSELERAGGLARPGSREAAAIENNLAIVLSREGRPDEAARAFERSAELALATGEVRFASLALANAADNLLRLDRTDDAEAAAARALDLASRVGDAVALSTARANLGLVFARRGELGRAEEQLLASVDLIARQDNPVSLADRYVEIARVCEAQGRPADAAAWRGRSEDLLARIRGPSAPSPARRRVGRPSDKTIK